MARRFALLAINFTLFIQNNSASYPRMNPNKQMLDVRTEKRERNYKNSVKSGGILLAGGGREANDFSL